MNWLRSHTAPLLSEPRQNIRFGVTFAQAVQPDRPLSFGRLDRGVFPIGAAPHLIAVFPQKHEEGLVSVGLPNDRVNVGADDAAHGGLVALLRLPLGVMFALALRDYDG